MEYVIRGAANSCQELNHPTNGMPLVSSESGKRILLIRIQK